MSAMLDLRGTDAAQEKMRKPTPILVRSQACEHQIPPESRGTRLGVMNHGGWITEERGEPEINEVRPLAS